MHHLGPWYPGQAMRARLISKQPVLKGKGRILESVPAKLQESSFARSIGRFCLGTPRRRTSQAYHSRASLGPTADKAQSRASNPQYQ
jgi:hypothetical protein